MDRTQDDLKQVIRILFNLRGQKETDSANGGGKDEI